jgi:hypothetical protein
VSKKDKNKAKEEIEAVQVKRIGVQLLIEKEGLAQDNFKLEKAKITTQIAQEGVKGEKIKLSTAMVQNSIGEVGLGKAQDKLSYERADRLLSQQEMAAKLQLKAINVASLREEIRHQGVMTGVTTSKIQGSNGKMFNSKEDKQSTSGSEESRSWGGNNNNSWGNDR